LLFSGVCLFGLSFLPVSPVPLLCRPQLPSPPPSLPTVSLHSSMFHFQITRQTTLTPSLLPQGYHDITTVLFLTLPPSLHLPCLEKLSLHRVRDSMGPGLEPVLGLVRYVFFLSPSFLSLSSSLLHFFLGVGSVIDEFFGYAL
jgi:hypothetical protein